MTKTIIVNGGEYRIDSEGVAVIATMEIVEIPGVYGD